MASPHYTRMRVRRATERLVVETGGRWLAPQEAVSLRALSYPSGISRVSAICEHDSLVLAPGDLELGDGFLKSPKYILRNCRFSVPAAYQLR